MRQSDPGIDDAALDSYKNQLTPNAYKKLKSLSGRAQTDAWLYAWNHREASHIWNRERIKRIQQGEEPDLPHPSVLSDISNKVKTYDVAAMKKMIKDIEQRQNAIRKKCKPQGREIL